MLLRVYKFSGCSIDLVDSLGSVGVNGDIIIAIDGGTNNTGLSILDRYSGDVLYSLRLYNNNVGESKLLQFKLEFKGVIKELLGILGGYLKGIYYEEPYIGYTSAVKPLYILESTIPELKLEDSRLSGVEYHTVNNKVWKRELFSKHKGSFGKDKYLDDKDKIRLCISEYYGKHTGFNSLQQDIYDSIGLGKVVVDKLINGDIGSILHKRKVTKYKYSAVDITSIVDELYNGGIDLGVISKYISDNYKSLGINKKIASLGKLKLLDTDKRGKRYLDIDERVRASMLDNSMCIYYGDKIDNGVILKYNLRGVLDSYGYICLVFHRATYKANTN